MLHGKSSGIVKVSRDTIAAAADALRAGKLVSFPTETVYGLGALAGDANAVAEVFAVKGRPAINPLICHVLDVPMAKRYVQWNDLAEKLAAAFWPGPLTLVLPRAADAPIALLASGLDTVAIRAPRHEVARALLVACDAGIVAPSANKSGRVSPTLAQHVRDEFCDEAIMILDGGACSVGIESTVVDCTDDAPVILRHGSVTAEDIKNATGMAAALADHSAKIKSPGMLLAHYAPSLPLRLNALDPKPDEVLLSFGNKIPAGAKQTFHLSRFGDLKEVAANVFALLRQADDATRFAGIAVMPVPEKGIGIAINDRLKRAAGAV